jgi:uncharacterized membrane protein YgaE (UPF0421/DUF939 family)
LGSDFRHRRSALHRYAARRRLATLCGHALGAALGALIATYFYANWMVYGVGIFACGILSALLRIGSAYRFAAITLSLVLLVAHTRPPWIVAAHRFVEVSLGIAVALVVAVVWPAPAS